MPKATRRRGRGPISKGECLFYVSLYAFIAFIMFYVGVQEKNDFFPGMQDKSTAFFAVSICFIFLSLIHFFKYRKICNEEEKQNR